ncbi:multicopper oxidase domain-containing protein [Corynebacterium imitans]|uniref:multicopper oxidase domain-containing protein n=1 Tax=Corynebacterium imitans TaxID=156978 RepID=UPI001EF38A2A|nr:multicopper oxidase domain-containing protein [Corynebacterium imitans]MCG7279238.1 multicopper oxidase domain-containing protein [Corynebacterium imitans]
MNRTESLAWGLIALVVALVVGLTLAFSPTDSAQAPISEDAATFDIDIQGMSFVPDTIHVAPGTHVVLNITNSDTQQHDLKLGDGHTGRIDPGETVTHDFGVFDEDTQGWCTIAGHKAMGMTFDVVTSGGGGASISGEGRDATLPEASGELHEHTWAIEDDGDTWTFDGQAPGPTLRGRVGDRFRITIENRGHMTHSIDFHAGEISPDEPMRDIQPGEHLTYEFTARRSGIWMYHCGTMPMSQHIGMGMVGAVVIDPPDLAPVDGEYLLIAREIYGDEPATAFNDHPAQYVERPIEARVGDTVRVWLLNAGPDTALSFHVVGEIFDTVYKEGTYSLRDAHDTGSQALDLLAAQGGFVELTFDEPGTYTFVNHQMTAAEQGQRGQFLVHAN